MNVAEQLVQMLQAVLGNQITEHQVDGFVCALI